MAWEGEEMCLVHGLSWRMHDSVWPRALAWDQLGSLTQDQSGAEVKAWPQTLVQDQSGAEVMIRRGWSHNQKIRKESAHWNPPELTGAHCGHAHRKRRNFFLGACRLYKGQRHFCAGPCFFFILSEPKVCASVYPNGPEVFLSVQSWPCFQAQHLVTVPLSCLQLDFFSPGCFICYVCMRD